jgi:hypothetical protein
LNRLLSIAFADILILLLPHQLLASWAANVDSTTGNYTVTDDAIGWKLSGSLKQAVTTPVTTSGTDGLGAYTSVSFRWDQDGPLSAEIRTYANRSTVVFRQMIESARPKPPMPFPTLTPPAKMHPFGYRTGTFAPPSFKGGDGPSPWLLFDDQNRAMILSAGDHFMVAGLKMDADKNLFSTFSIKLENLPANYSHQTVLTEGDSIHQAWDRWGHVMTALTGKVRPANDSTPELSKLGYWTDNGSFYYYHYNPARGYDGTLLDVAAAYKKLSIPLAYVQLDSWWYIKTTTNADGKKGGKIKNSKLPAGTWNCYGGLTEYVAHPFVFPEGLPAFDKELGLPLITHNRWIDVDSPYRKRYRISGVAAIDPKWWDDITGYLKSANVIVYEQDWLDQIYENSPEFRSTTTAGDAFMDNMARATRERGMSMQYCMELPEHYLQGSKYDNLTSVRVAGDRFERGKWTDALYVSHMASALGEWPWVDTFRSAETANLILATLTAGPVGFGDDMDKIDAKNIATCILPDGVIVKPDTSIVPLDRTYLADATDHKSPMIAAAYTDHGPHRTAYVFAYPRNADQMQIQFKPADLGIASDIYVFEPATGHGEVVPAGGAFTATFADASYKKAWSYFVVAPIAPSGIALTGDSGKITTAGRRRISAIEDKSDSESVTVKFAAAEKSITLTGYAARQPAVTVAIGGTSSPVKFDAATHQFTAEITPAAGSSAVQLTFSAK